jgi:hypothetical protein
MMTALKSPVRYRPADQFPPLKSATEVVANYAGWNVPQLVIARFQDVAPVAGRRRFIVPPGSWGRIDVAIFNSVATAPYLGVVGQGIYWQLTNNGVAIPGYTFMTMDVPQSDGVSANMKLPMTLVIPPGTQQSIGIGISFLVGVALPYVSVLLRGWVWSETSDALWRSGRSQTDVG